LELILVRHGLPERRDDTADPPLSPMGHEQARRVAAWLAHERIDAVFSSTMLRARQTASRSPVG
jgi:probable phosphoglycerate mutase